MVHLVLPTALFPQESLQALVCTYLTAHQKVLAPVGLNLKLRTVHLGALWILHLIHPVGLVSLWMGFVLSVTIVFFKVIFSLICLMGKFKMGLVLYVTIVMFEVIFPLICLMVKFGTGFWLLLLL